MKAVSKINTESLCILKLNANKNIVNIDYIPIVKNHTLSSKFAGLTHLNEDENYSVADLISYSESNLTELLQEFSHCESLKDSYQQLPQNTHNQFLSRFHELNKRISDTPSENSYLIKVLNDDLISLKKKFYFQMLRRLRAIEISSAYKICENDKSILTFSHRRIGWSNPSYKLTSNFTFDIKTNFGYGHVSYFYTKLIFKGIEIVPFSDWVYYPNANFSEIIRFSKKHELEDKDWVIALSYAKDACNLSLTNESAFIAKYIVSECERMVSELESLLSKNEFVYHQESIKSDEKSFRIEPITQKIVLSSHALIEYRGEKISGSLNFIEKILLFEKIRNMSSFVQRIKDLNLKVLPILKNEVPLIVSEISNLKIKQAEIKSNLDSLNPDYETYKRVFHEFNSKERIINPTLSGDQNSIIESKFNASHPELKIIKDKYLEINLEYLEISNKVNALEMTNRNINSYIGEIHKFFKYSN